MPALQDFLAHFPAAVVTLCRSCTGVLRGTSPQDLLLAGRAAFLVFSFVVAAVTFTRWRRAAERDTAHTSGQLEILLTRLEHLEQLTAQSEPRVAALGEQIEAHFKSASGRAPENYPIAIRLARAGAAPAELMASCGLTRREADLVTRVHGQDASRGAPRPAHLGRASAA